MTNAMKASQDLISLANKFKSIVEVAGLLEEIGSLEQAARDAIIVKDKAYKEKEEAEKLLLDKKAEVKLAYDAIEAAQEDCKKVKMQAQAAGHAIIEDANKKAALIVEASDKKLAEYKVEYQKYHNESVKLAADCAAKQKYIDDMNAQIAQTKARIEALVK